MATGVRVQPSINDLAHWPRLVDPLFELRRLVLCVFLPIALLAVPADVIYTEVQSKARLRELRNIAGNDDRALHLNMERSFDYYHPTGKVVVEGVASILSLFLLLLILPRRPPDVLLLRSFGEDWSSGPLRRSIIRGLGAERRISGLRMPKIRWFPFFRGLAVPIWVFQQMNPRFMSMEAGDDNWKHRLLASLATDIDMLIVDVSRLTEFLEWEIRMLAEAYVIQSVLFVARGKDAAHWRTAVAGALNQSEGVNHLQIAVYRGGWYRRDQEFEQAVREFASTHRAVAVQQIPRELQDGFAGIGRIPYWLSFFVGAALAPVVWITLIDYSINLAMEHREGAERWLLAFTFPVGLLAIWSWHLLEMWRDAPFLSARIRVVMAALIVAVAFAPLAVHLWTDL